MKWIQIKKPKWIGGRVYPNQKPKASTWRRQRLTWSGSAEEKCVEADRRRGSELDDGGDVDDGRAGDVERVSLRGLRWEMTVNEREWMRPDLIKWKKKKKKKQVIPYRSELDDGGDIERVELERNERWTRESENESEWMIGFDKMNKK